MKSLLVALSLAGSATLFAAGNPALLVSGERMETSGDRRVISGNARVVVKGPQELRLACERMVHENGVLRCSGDVTIRSGDHVLRAQEVSIDTREKAVLFLNPGGITIGAAESAAGTFNPGSVAPAPALEFKGALPPTSTQLPRSSASR